jgi:NAD(P)-dependent dehydrogenase (short-subunit alcohol dehydrogenase family)
VELQPWGIAVSIVEPGTIRTPIWARGAAKADELLAAGESRAGELYGGRIAAMRRVAAKRGAAGAPPETVAKVIEAALTADRPRTRSLVGRDARIRATIERLPARARDRVYDRLLLRD